MRPEGAVRVLWTRAELLALREAIEVTPNFEGRQDVRDILRMAVRAPRMREVAFDPEIAARLGNRLVPVDLATATARAKLLRAVRGKPGRRVAVPPRRTQPAVGVGAAQAAA